MSEPAPEVILRAEGITAGYGGLPIIEDISLTVRAGKITAIVGPNGAGKSTLLKTLSGVLKPSRGEVYVLGKKTTGTPPEKLVKYGLSYVPRPWCVVASQGKDAQRWPAQHARHGQGTHARARRHAARRAQLRARSPAPGSALGADRKDR